MGCTQIKQPSDYTPEVFDELHLNEKQQTGKCKTVVHFCLAPVIEDALKGYFCTSY